MICASFRLSILTCIMESYFAKYNNGRCIIPLTAISYCREICKKMLTNYLSQENEKNHKNPCWKCDFVKSTRDD